MWEQEAAVGGDGVFILYSSHWVEQVRRGLPGRVCMKLLNTGLELNGDV